MVERMSAWAKDQVEPACGWLGGFCRRISGHRRSRRARPLGEPEGDVHRSGVARTPGCPVGEARIMQQFFMAFVTVDTAPAFMTPRARLEYSVSLRATSISRTPEKPFRHEVVLARV